MKSCGPILALGIALGLGLIVTGCGPIGWMPGFRIGGSSASAPLEWKPVDVAHRCRIQTAGGALPRTHHIWAVTDAGKLYIIGQASNRWVERALIDPAVLFRSHDRTYEVRLVEVTDPLEHDAAEAVYATKYAAEIAEYREDGGNFGELKYLMFRLEPR